MKMKALMKITAQTMQTRHIRWALPLKIWSVAHPAPIVPTIANISNTPTDHAASSMLMLRASVRNLGTTVKYAHTHHVYENVGNAESPYPTVRPDHYLKELLA